MFYIENLGVGELKVEIYNSEKFLNGTTLFADLHNTDEPRIVEVNMEGETIWEYNLPDNLKNYTDPGMDVELLPNNDVLFIAPLKGVFQINRQGTIVWSYIDDKVSHDADRLPNGNTLIIWGGSDGVDDAQVKEVNSTGDIVWFWKAKDHYYYPPYKDIYMQGWTHANAVTRLPNGNTLVNLRNFNLTVEVNSTGDVVWEYDWSSLGDDPHEPQVLSNGNILIALQGNAPNQAVEIKRATGVVVWEYWRENMIFTRDTNRLPNGNTLIVSVVDNSSKIFEVTPDGEIVWQIAIKGQIIKRYSPGWFYKAQRIVH